MRSISAMMSLTEAIKPSSEGSLSIVIPSSLNGLPELIVFNSTSFSHVGILAHQLEEWS